MIVKTTQKILGLFDNLGNMYNTALLYGRDLPGLNREHNIYRLSVGDKLELTLLKGKEDDLQHVFNLLFEEAPETYNNKQVIVYRFFTEDDSRKTIVLALDLPKPLTAFQILNQDGHKITASENTKAMLRILVENEEQKTEETEENYEPEEVINNERLSNTNYLLEQFERQKKERYNELNNELSTLEEDINNYEKELAGLRSKISFTEDKIEKTKIKYKKVFQNLKNFEPDAPFNGVYFHIGENINTGEWTKAELNLSLKNSEIDSDFTRDNVFIVRLGYNYQEVLMELKDYKLLDKTLRNVIEDCGLEPINDDGLAFKYTGKNTWHDLVKDLKKRGFGQNSKFDELCGSNTYGHAPISKPKFTPDLTDESVHIVEKEEKVLYVKCLLEYLDDTEHISMVSEPLLEKSLQNWPEIYEEGVLRKLELIDVELDDVIKAVFEFGINATIEKYENKLYVTKIK